ncbi:MAG TPA: alpha/beta hydrolase [Rhizomicrobium sp.]|jgi:pimeloyl-ACP methyl ester carboxylesterase|nr:alpha/beta hydrolase [Rhizomicrobium sp.]
MTDFTFIDLPDIRLRAAIAGKGPLVVMVHGFPESWFSWRHQMAPIAAAGFTACAIDVRGYGGSDRPSEVADYAMERMVADVGGVIEKLSPRAPAIVLGHDWGAPIVWNTALIRPDRVRAVGALSVPYLGPPERPFSAIFDEIFTRRGKFFYQAYFQKPRLPEAEAEADPRGFLRKFYYALSGDAPDGTWPTDKTSDMALLDGLTDPAAFPAWLTPAELDYYVGEFSRSGFFGPISRYRNHERDFDYLRRYAERKIEQPAFFVSGTRDLAFNMFRGADPIALMRRHVPDLRVADVLEGCGHWTQQERPAEVNARLIPWLKGL